MDDEQQGGSILEPIGRAAVDAAQGAAAEIGAMSGDGGQEGPGAAIGRATADIFDSPRDPASGVDDGGVGASISKAAQEAWDAGSDSRSGNLDWEPIGGEGPAHLPDADRGGSTDPWAAPSGGDLPPDIETLANPVVEPLDDRIN